jgi:hypothetical protein
VGIDTFKTKFEIYFAMPLCCTKSIIYKDTDSDSTSLQHRTYNAEQSKGILIFKMLSSAFPLPLVAYTILEHMPHAKLSGFIFSVEENVTTAVLGN